MTSQKVMKKQKGRNVEREARGAGSEKAGRDRRKRLRAYYDGTYDGPPCRFALRSHRSLFDSRTHGGRLSALGTGARAQWRLDDDAYDDFTDYFAAQLRHIDARKQTSGEPMPRVARATRRRRGP